MVVYAYALVDLLKAAFFCGENSTVFFHLLRPLCMLQLLQQHTIPKNKQPVPLLQ